MTDLRTAAQQALEALEADNSKLWPSEKRTTAITALRAALAEDTRDWSLLEATQESLREHMAEIQRLRAALAQPAASGEPEKYIAHLESLLAAYKDELRKIVQPAPARVPLTDEQINQITAEQWGAGLGAPYAAYRAYARAIEAAHGIAPDAQQESKP